MPVEWVGTSELVFKTRALDTARHTWIVPEIPPIEAISMLLGAGMLLFLAWATGSTLLLAVLGLALAMMVVVLVVVAGASSVDLFVGVLQHVASFAASLLLWRRLEIVVRGRSIRWNGRDVDHLEVRFAGPRRMLVSSGSDASFYWLSAELTEKEQQLIVSALLAAGGEDGTEADVPEALRSVRQKLKRESGSV